MKEELGPRVEFQERGHRAQIVRYASGDVNDRESWPEMFAWLKSNGEELKNALQERVKALVLERTASEDDSGNE